MISTDVDSPFTQDKADEEGKQKDFWKNKVKSQKDQIKTNCYSVHLNK